MEFEESACQPTVPRGAAVFPVLLGVFVLVIVDVDDGFISNRHALSRGHAPEPRQEEITITLCAVAVLCEIDTSNELMRYQAVILSRYSSQREAHHERGLLSYRNG